MKRTQHWISTDGNIYYRDELGLIGEAEGASIKACPLTFEVRGEEFFFWPCMQDLCISWDGKGCKGDK